jgi:hypothetical protein
MTKAELIKALENMPDDALIVVDLGIVYVPLLSVDKEKTYSGDDVWIIKGGYIAV